jgi:hypothetical protein
MQDVCVTRLGTQAGTAQGGTMLELLERPAVTPARGTQDDVMNRAALWIVDALAEELARDMTQDRRMLVQALLRRAGYEQADNLVPGDAEAVRAALVARLAGRLAQG